MSYQFVQFKKIAAAVISVGIIFVAYFGNYLPLRKSLTYISALRNLSRYRSVTEFEDAFSASLDIASPVGQEELVRNTGSVILNVIQGSKQPGPVVTELVKYAEKYFKPLVDYGRGMSFGQDIYILGALNATAFRQTGNGEYLLAAENYFRKGLVFSPKRPQYLYGLFDIYRMGNDLAKGQDVGEKILSLWPINNKAKGQLEGFLGKDNLLQ